MLHANRQTLCFLHGWCFDRRVWTGFAESLLPEWNIKLLALPGYDGTAPRVLGMNEVASALLADIPDDASLVGWSLGGMIGIKIAAMKPVQKLIMMASAPCFVRKRDWSCGMEEKRLETIMRNLNDNPGAALQEFALLSSRGSGNQRAIYQKLSGLLEGICAHKDALRDGLNMLLHEDLRAEFAGLKCKTSVMLAANDRLFSASAGEAMLSLLPGLRIDVIEDSGHALFMSRPAQARQSLLSILSMDPR